MTAKVVSFTGGSPMCHGVRVGSTLLRFSIACFVLLFAVPFLFTAKGATITVPAGGSLQNAINAAQPGDTIILQDGVVYAGPIELPVKSGTSYITIQSSRVGELPDGVRVTPAQRSLLASVQSSVPAEPILRRRRALITSSSSASSSQPPTVAYSFTL